MPLNVTIADDSAMSRKGIRRALPADWDVVIHEACNGKEALAAVDEGHADVLFLDLTMPEMDGFEVLTYLKNHHKKIVVIVISADIQPQAQALVYQLGAFRFLQKPLQAGQLHEVLHEMGLL
ncbi:response regulator [Alkalimonas amylolytica]|uniref:Response regulator receiver domain-containing protein n=1 Tax=Alkalimonas amylolytica TaxID=152573 RepID=A0A1H3ZI03_ALKAM|nr:response regulator [Alkalimonas amylolytica]SEA23198.1 Response regulator receiver domain-containing protein [Alkalimonas amylolytica]